MCIAKTHQSYHGAVKDGDTGVCLDCMEEVAAVTVKDSSGCDDFPLYISESGCCCKCGAGLFEGHLWLDKVTRRKAKKTHCGTDGNMILPGMYYDERIVKGYYFDDKGKRNGIFNIKKTLCTNHSPVK